MNDAAESPLELKVYSPEEIDIFLSGERRDVDRLLLHGLNNLAIVLINHIPKEEEMFKVMGTNQQIRTRAAWIDAQIDAQVKRNGMMARVAEATLGACLLLFIGYIGVSLWDHTVALINAAKQVRSQ